MTATLTRPAELAGCISTRGQSHRYSYSYRSTKHIVFVGGNPDPSMPMPPYSIKGQDPANDAAWRAYNNREIAIMRAAAAEALELDPAEFRFSRKAGCSCGCSPGFRVRPRVDLPAGWATWVQVKPAE
jgi:hypothetical protein